MEQANAAPLIIGGILSGVWVWWALFEDSGWLGWGLLGAVLAGAVYTIRWAPPAYRPLVWVAIGIAIAFLVMTALMQERVQVLATVLSFLGGVLIVLGLPGPQQDFVPAQEPRTGH